MIRSLYLSNFKAFGDTGGQPIPIRPLTLIFGPNSAGKSSLIHSLLLAHEALHTGNLDVHHTRAGGRSVDLGGFRQYVHRHRTEAPVQWGVALSVEDLAEKRLQELLSGADTLKVLLHIGMEHLEDERTGEVRPVGPPHVRRYEVEIDGKLLLTMSRRRTGYLQLDRLHTTHPILKRVMEAILLAHTTTAEIRPDDLHAVERSINEITPALKAQGAGLLPRRLDALRNFSAVGETLFPISREHRRSDIEGATRLFLPRILNTLLEGIHDALTQTFSRMSYLGPLRSYPPRHFAFSDDQDPNWQAGGGHAWDLARRDEKIREAINRWLRSDRFTNPYELRIRRLISDRSEALQQQLHRALEELGKDQAIALIGGALQPNEEGLPEGWDTDLLTRRFMKYLTDPDAVEGYAELVLWDVQRETEVSHRDVGVGVSQVLPVLVLAYACQNSLVAIEQPEIHVHPALQAELGDVFIESALGPRKNTFLIETHSEHLMLRILRRIREQTEGEADPGLPSIRPTDVSVLYVDPRGSDTIVKAIPITKDGDFAERWPAGFFTEREKELF